MASKQERWNESKNELVAAAKEVGIDEGVMIKIAGFESSFNSHARPIHSKPELNKVRQFDGVMAMSSAYGYGQFIDSTWKQMINTYGEKHGIEGASHFTKEQANALRNDTKVQALMLAEFTRENIQKGQKLGGSDVDANVYAFHNLGAGDATNFLKALKNNPNQSVNGVLSSDVISVNKSLYGDGHITVAQAYANMGSKMRENQSYAIEVEKLIDPESMLPKTPNMHYNGSQLEPVSPQSSLTPNERIAQAFGDTEQAKHKTEVLSKTTAAIHELCDAKGYPNHGGRDNMACYLAHDLLTQGAQGTGKYEAALGTDGKTIFVREELSEFKHITASADSNAIVNIPKADSLAKIEAYQAPVITQPEPSHIQQVGRSL